MAIITRRDISFVGEETRDETLRTSAWEAKDTSDEFFSTGSEKEEATSVSSSVKEYQILTPSCAKSFSYVDLVEN